MLRVSAAEPVIYRVVQEALTNALRHAAGSHVTVTISSAREDTVVEIVDDGPGATVSTRRGYGLIGLAERVQRLGWGSPHRSRTVGPRFSGVGGDSRRPSGGTDMTVSAAVARARIRSAS